MDFVDKRVGDDLRSFGLDTKAYRDVANQDFAVKEYDGRFYIARSKYSNFVYVEKVDDKTGEVVIESCKLCYRPKVKDSKYGIINIIGGKGHVTNVGKKLWVCWSHVEASFTGKSEVRWGARKQETVAVAEKAEEEKALEMDSAAEKLDSLEEEGEKVLETVPAAEVSSAMEDRGEKLLNANSAAKDMSDVGMDRDDAGVIELELRDEVRQELLLEMDDKYKGGDMDLYTDEDVSEDEKDLVIDDEARDAGEEKMEGVEESDTGEDGNDDNESDDFDSDSEPSTATQLLTKYGI